MKKYICRFYNQDDDEWCDVFNKNSTNCKVVGFKELFDLIFECEVGRFSTEEKAFNNILENIKSAIENPNGYFDITGDPDSGEPTEYQLISLKN